MDGFGTTLAIGALKAIAFVCDILTFPVYVLLQRPWRVRALSRKVKVSQLQPLKKGTFAARYSFLSLVSGGNASRVFPACSDRLRLRVAWGKGRGAIRMGDKRP